jgi:hypothetical protein
VAEGNAAAQTALGTQQQIGNMLTAGWNTATGQGTSLAENAASQGLTASQMLAQMGQTGYQNAASQAGNIGSTNLQAGLQAAQQLPTQAAAQSNLTQQQTAALQAAGTAQQQQQQAVDNANQGQFYQQQEWPYQNLDTLLSAVGAVPYGTSSNTTGTGTSTQSTNPGLMNNITGSIGLAGDLATTAASPAMASLLGFL